MCGIFCSLSTGSHILPNGELAVRLKKRGPDSTNTLTTICPGASTSPRADSSCVNVTLHATVLGLRGDSITEQPYTDADGEYTLCWNGEAWSVAGESVSGNDTSIVHQLLRDALQASTDTDPSNSAIANAKRIASALSTVSGPYAFAFLDHALGTLYFGRDFLGRRSLLTRFTSDGDFIITSVCDDDFQADWKEVEADGIFYINLFQPRNSPDGSNTQSPGSIHFKVQWVPYQFATYQSPSFDHQISVIPRLSLNKDTSPSQHCLDEHSSAVLTLHQLLRASLTPRVCNIFSDPQNCDNLSASNESSSLAVLFSGGLDCTVLARMCHDLLPLDQSVDLLNVAFENPRIHKGGGSAQACIYDSCPDRVTGEASFTELQRVCADRAWHFVKIDVPYADYQSHRDTIVSLMHPHNTEMDLSIASALYFALRGKGQVSLEPELSESSPEPSRPYNTSARVLLSGLGADELFAGYTRHATAFNRDGLAGLVDELELDVTRLGKRNLGRDDRVMSHWGREVRFPYLDEALLSWALSAHVNDKCGFGERIPSTMDSKVTNGSAALEPAKKVLRCLAWKIGLENAATYKKRAIQFGARTAKMESGKTKGTHVLT